MGSNPSLVDRLTIRKGGLASCIFNSCIEKGISAGAIYMHAAPGEIPSSSQQLKLQEPCTLLYLVTLGRALAALTVVMEREFHQVMHAYK